jgi:hypothetical protein
MQKLRVLERPKAPQIVEARRTRQITEGGEVRTITLIAMCALLAGCEAKVGPHSQGSIPSHETNERVSATVKEFRDWNAELKAHHEELQKSHVEFALSVGMSFGRGYLTRGQVNQLLPTESPFRNDPTNMLNKRVGEP